MNSDWQIKSITSAGSAAFSPKIAINELTPPNWPSGWDIIDRQSSDKLIYLKLAHINPLRGIMKDMIHPMSINPYITEQQLAELIKSQDEAKTTSGFDLDKVEMSDLKGNKLVLTENQGCSCTQELGLQNLIDLPIDLKKQLGE